MPALFGPQVVYNYQSFGVRDRSGQILRASPLVTANGLIGAILSVYYLLDLSYPSAYGQVLGFLQESVLGVPFVQKNKSCSNLLLRVFV